MLTKSTLRCVWTRPSFRYQYTSISLRNANGQWANWLAVRMILPAWFDHLEECFSYKEFQLKKFCPPVKTSCPPTENVNQTPPCFWHAMCTLLPIKHHLCYQKICFHSLSPCHHEHFNNIWQHTGDMTWKSQPWETWCMKHNSFSQQVNQWVVGRLHCLPLVGFTIA